MEAENVKSALEEEMELYQAADSPPPAEEPPASSSAEAVAEPPATPENPETPAETPAEAPAVTEQPEEKPAKEGSKTVPLSALLEERDKRQKLEQELAVERARKEERERLEREAAERRQREQPPPPAEDPIKAAVIKEIGERPKDDDDPISAAEWDRQYNAQYTAKKAAADAEYARRTAEEMALLTHLRNEREAFKREKPDYEDAFKHLFARRKKFYMHMPSVRKLPEAQREAAALWYVNRDAGLLIQDARENGDNVAQTIYEMAVDEGYPGPQAPDAPAAPEVKPPTAAEKLAMVEEGQKITSLDRGGHGGATLELTDEQIDAMSQGELRQWMKNPKNAERYRRMLGGE